MDPRHRELARIGLAATQDYGFALAGGYALVTHGLVDRPTEDVDLFTNHLDPDEFARAVETISAAYEGAGQPVTVIRRAELYARLHVGQDDPVQVELAYDWRSEIPARFAIGPVLDRDDVVAGKVLALWGRQEARDYIDVHAALAPASTPKVTCSGSPSARTPVSTSARSPMHSSASTTLMTPISPSTAPDHTTS